MRIIALGAVLSLVGNMLAVMSIDAANRIAAQAVTVPNPVNPKLGNVPVANPGFAPITGSSLQPGLSSGMPPASFPSLLVASIRRSLRRPRPAVAW